MKKKFLITILAVLSLVMTAFAATLLTACSGEEKFPSWELSSTVKASFTDNGKYGYILTVDGTGEMPDYATKRDTPWYGKSGRVTEIKLGDKITSVGDNAFTQCVYVEQIILPESVTSVGKNAFSENTQCFAYSSSVTVADDTVVYKYSETAPTTAGNFWHLKNDIITIWESTVVTTKVLFIGNSFTFYSDIPNLFKEIATSADKSVVVDSITRGSWTLTKFADATDEEGAKVEAKLNENKDYYDVVVLQDQSTRPVDNYSGFLSGAQALQTKINATQKNAKIYLYSTWGYAEAADPLKITIPEYELKLRDAYEKAATVMGVKVSYVGAAFSKVYTDYPDLASKLYFYADNKHPSYLGAYLSACVHVATILNCDPRISSFVGEPSDKQDVKLDEATAKILRQVAYEIVFNK